jgi:hypothetical protein
MIIKISKKEKLDISSELKRIVKQIDILEQSHDLNIILTDYIVETHSRIYNCGVGCPRVNSSSTSIAISYSINCCQPPSMHI